MRAVCVKCTCVPKLSSFFQRQATIKAYNSKNISHSPPKLRKGIRDSSHLPAIALGGSPEHCSERKKEIQQRALARFCHSVQLTERCSSGHSTGQAIHLGRPAMKLHEWHSSRTGGRLLCIIAPVFRWEAFKLLGMNAISTHQRSKERLLLFLGGNWNDVACR